MITAPIDAHPASRTLPIPTGFTPEGIHEGLFDENTLYLITHALPERYQQIFLHLLYYATADPKTTMQPSLFEATGESNGEAIILYKSVAELAKTPNSPAGPETYQKGIVLFEAINVVSRTFHHGYTEVRMPLGKREILLPALLLSLRVLHGDEKRKGYANPKVKQLARKVAKKLQSEEFVRGIPRPSSAQGLELSDVLTTLLRAHGIADEQIKLETLARASQAITQALHTAIGGRVAGKRGESAKARVRKAWTRRGDSHRNMGDSASSHDTDPPSASLISEHTEGDSKGAESPDRFCSDRSRQSHRRKMGDLDAIFGPESPERWTNLLLSAQVGDSEPSLSIIVPSSLVITSNKEETIIDTIQHKPAYVDSRPHREIQRDAYGYQNRFDKGRGRQFPGSLMNTVKFTPPEIRHLAAIATHFYTTFRLPNGSVIKAPGGFFTNTCKLYQQPEADIPQEVRAWAATGLSLDEIEVQLKNGSRYPGQATFPWVTQDGDTDSSLDREGTRAREEALYDVTNQQERYELPIAPCRSFTEYDCMDQDEAETLRVHIEQEGYPYQIHAWVESSDQKGIFLVITTWGGVEVVHRTMGEWDEYFAETKACLAL